MFSWYVVYFLNIRVKHLLTVDYYRSKHQLWHFLLCTKLEEHLIVCHFKWPVGFNNVHVTNGLTYCLYVFIISTYQAVLFCYSVRLWLVKRLIGDPDFEVLAETKGMIKWALSNCVCGEQNIYCLVVLYWERCGRPPVGLEMESNIFSFNSVRITFSHNQVSVTRSHSAMIELYLAGKRGERLDGLDQLFRIDD